VVEAGEVSRNRAPSNAVVDPLPPARSPIEGQYIRLEPADARVYTEKLFAAASEDAAVLDYLGYGLLSSREP
jgi:hypothetical protein